MPQKRNKHSFKKGHKTNVGKHWKLGYKAKQRGKPFKKGHKVNWKGGITPINNLIRNSEEYKLWRKAVFERDNYKCVWCGIRGVTIHADHIKPFALFPELRFAIDNGRTLCVPCHRTTDTYGKKSSPKFYAKMAM